MDDTSFKSSFLLALDSSLLIIYKRLDSSLTMKIITFSFLFLYTTNLYLSICIYFIQLFHFIIHTLRVFVDIHETYFQLTNMFKTDTASTMKYTFYVN